MHQNANTSMDGSWCQHCFGMSRNSVPGKQHLWVSGWPVMASQWFLFEHDHPKKHSSWTGHLGMWMLNSFSELKSLPTLKDPAFLHTSKHQAPELTLSKSKLHPSHINTSFTRWLAQGTEVPTWHCAPMASRARASTAASPVRGCYSRRASGNTRSWATFVCTCVCTRMHTALCVHPLLSSSKWRLSVSSMLLQMLHLLKASLPMWQ